MDKLDEHGQQLYNAFIQHRDAWVAYITPIALRKLDNYLSSQGRDYNLNEYWNRYISNHTTSTHKPTKDTTARYKKLSILFHPDKFDKPGATAFFSLLNKYHKEGNGELLDIIDTISHLLLELPSLEKIVTNLEHLTNADTLTMKKEPSVILELLNSDNPALPNKECDNCNSSINPEQFLDSVCYKFFTGIPDSIKYVNQIFLTEAEIILKIANSQDYEEDFVLFCRERYADNRAILEAVVKWQMARNEKLKKENEAIKAKLGNLD